MGQNSSFVKDYATSLNHGMGSGRDMSDELLARNNSIYSKLGNNSLYIIQRH